MKNIVIYGAGGFGREVKMLIDIINENSPIWNFLGYIADIEPDNKEAASLLIGNIDFINNYLDELHVVLATGSPAGLKIMHSKITNSKLFSQHLFTQKYIYTIALGLAMEILLCLIARLL